MKTYPSLNKAPRRDDVWDNGGIVPSILNLGTWCGWMVSFMFRLL